MEDFPTAEAGTGHIVLLGDSIFDNAAYVGGGPAVIAQLRHAVPGWKCTLLAVDGDVVGGVSRQLVFLPSDATHLVVSAGGNDALAYAPLLQERSSSVAEALAMLASAQDTFAADYGAMLDRVGSAGHGPIDRHHPVREGDGIESRQCGRSLRGGLWRLACSSIRESCRTGRYLTRRFPDRLALRS